MDQLLENAIISPQNFAFRDLLGLDMWVPFAPIRTGWTDVGVPTVTAFWRDVGAQCFFQIKVVPATTVATVLATSYIALPRPAKGLCGEGSMQDFTTKALIGGCTVDVSNSRLYVPAWAASGDTILIAGWYQI